MNTIINIVACVTLTFLWLGFGAALLFNKEILDSAWRSFRGIPLLMQIVVAFFILPVTLALWIWETSWHKWLRLILVAGLAWITEYTFFPRPPMA